MKAVYPLLKSRPAPRVVCASQLLVLLILLSGCQSFFGVKLVTREDVPQQQTLTFSGQGAGEVALDGWEGPVVVHLTASDGSQPFSVAAVSGLDFQELSHSDASVDEYRGLTVDPASKMQVRFTGDRTWKMELLPVDAESFDILQIPGTFSGQGNRVVVVQGKHSVATFDTDRSESFEAWALGESQQWQHLQITASGDYKGKSVLPTRTRVIVVSASGPWSVTILEPCCEKKW